jgi:hypothetical protein
MKTCRRKLLIMILAALAVVGTLGLAQAKTLDGGTFYIEPKVGFYGNTNSKISSMFSYGAEAGYFIFDNFSLGGEFLGYAIYQKKNPYSGSNSYQYDANAFSPIAIARYHFYSTDKMSLFAGVGLGGFFSDKKVPRNGYDSNLTEIGEVGFNVFITEMVSLQLAGRWQHIGEYGSNSGSSPKGSDNFGGNFAVKFVF